MTKSTLKILGTVLLLLGTYSGFGQQLEDKTLMELAAAHKNYMSEQEPPPGLMQQLVSAAPASLKGAARFIAQTTTAHNDLLTPAYLTLPEEETLKNIYYVTEVNANLQRGTADDKAAIIAGWRQNPVPRIALVNCYYNLLFTAVGNKDKPFNLAACNLTLASYGLRDETEKGICFLYCMQLCNKNIWGFMNIKKPANTKLALTYIQRFPRVNGQPYFHYTALDFADFPIRLAGEAELQSAKFFLLNKYYDLLLSHLSCLEQEGASKAEITSLVTNSILKNRALFKYTTKQAQLERLLNASR